MLPTSGSKSNVLSRIVPIFLILSIFLFPLAIVPFTIDAINFPKEYLLYGAVALMLTFTIIAFFFDTTWHWRSTVFDLPIALLTFFVIASSWWSLDAGVSWWGRPDIFLLHIALVLAWVIWFFLAIQFTTTPRTWRTALDVFLFSGGLVNLFFVLVHAIPTWSNWGKYNLIAHTNTLMGVFVVINMTIHLGLLLQKNTFIRTFAYSIGAALGLAAALQLGFTVVWALLAIATGLLIFVGLLRRRTLRIVPFFIVIVLFVVSLVWSMLESPASLRAPLPTEVSLGAKASWGMVGDMHRSNIADALVGTGLATFPYDFAKFRTPAFNMTALVDNIYFNAPYSTAFALLAEMGWIGTSLFLSLLVMGASTAFYVFRTYGSTKHTEKLLERFEHADGIPATWPTLSWELAIVGVAWLTLSFALFITVFEVSIWWLWWWLLASLVAGTRVLGSDRFIKIKTGNLVSTSPYRSVVMFGLIIVLAGLVLGSTWLTRWYLADYSFNRAVTTNDLAAKNDWLSQTLQLRPNYAPYHLALSTIGLGVGLELSKQPHPNADEIGRALGPAINEAKTATELEPNNFKTWEQLGSVYLNAAPIVTGASQWAVDSFKHAIVLTPTGYLLHEQAGNAYILTNDAKSAEAEYLRAIANKADYIDAYSSLADLYEKEQAYDKAIGVYNPIATLVRSNPDLLFSLGRLFYNRGAKGDTERAETVWLRAVELQPNFSNVLYSLGLLNERRGNYPEALKYYHQVLNLNPNNTDVKAKIKAIGG